ncbi:MAG TPA: HBL/NHE enterotoxin family protein [Caldilineaceae bacterium]|nr:HBL/NHE enterotoxin family protein [Caldilineaceae bacterium]
MTTATRTTLQTNALSVHALQIAVEEIAATDILLQMYANGLAAQPDLPIPQAPTLPTHQQALRKTIDQSYIQGVEPATFQCYADISAYCNEFNVFCGKLEQLGYQLSAGDTNHTTQRAVANELSQALLVFIKVIQTNLSTNQQTMGLATSLQQSMAALQKQFDADLQLVETLFHQGEIADLQAAVNAEFDAINKDNQQIANGAVKGLKPVLEIMLGVVKAAGKILGGGGTAESAPPPENGDDTFDLFIEGVKDAKHVNAELDAIVDDVNRRIVAYGQLLMTLKMDQSRYALVQALVQRVTAMSRASANSVDAFTKLHQGWQSLADHLQELIVRLNDGAATGSEIITALQTAKDEIQQLHSTVQYLQELGQLPVTQARLPVAA